MSCTPLVPPTKPFLPEFSPQAKIKEHEHEKLKIIEHETMKLIQTKIIEIYFKG